VVRARALPERAGAKPGGEGRGTEIIYSEYKHAILLSYINVYLKNKRKYKIIKADREYIIKKIQAI
jgi:hypothetical protein